MHSEDFESSAVRNLSEYIPTSSVQPLSITATPIRSPLQPMGMNSPLLSREMKTVSKAYLAKQEISKEEYDLQTIERESAEISKRIEMLRGLKPSNATQLQGSSSGFTNNSSLEGGKANFGGTFH